MAGKWFCLAVCVKVQIFYCNCMGFLPLHNILLTKIADALNSQSSDFGTRFVRELLSEVSHVKTKLRMHICHDCELITSWSYTGNLVPLHRPENIDFFFKKKTNVPMYFYIHLGLGSHLQGMYPGSLEIDKDRKTDYSRPQRGRVRWRLTSSF